jgi:hypothetical protein
MDFLDAGSGEQSLVPHHHLAGGQLFAGSQGVAVDASRQFAAVKYHFVFSFRFQGGSQGTSHDLSQAVLHPDFDLGGLFKVKNDAGLLAERVGVVGYRKPLVFQVFDAHVAVLIEGVKGSAVAGDEARIEGNDIAGDVPHIGGGGQVLGGANVIHGSVACGAGLAAAQAVVGHAGLGAEAAQQAQAEQHTGIWDDFKHNFLRLMVKGNRAENDFA